MTDENDERLDGLRLEDLTVESNEGAPDGYGYGTARGDQADEAREQAAPG